MDYKFDKMPLINFIKTLTIYRGMSLRKLLKKLHEEKGYSSSYSGFYNKLKNQTLKFSEVYDIAESLEYEIILKDIKLLSKK